MIIIVGRCEPASGSHQYQSPEASCFSTELTNPLSLRESVQSGSGLHRSFANRRFSWSRDASSLGWCWFRTLPSLSELDSAWCL